jgi:hypothetical protein
MILSPKILTARRSYEFRQDDIRLTLLGNQGVMEHIRQHFSFRTAEFATPAAPYGWVPPTFPSGLVFALGITPFPENGATAIRFMHLEPRRIVIEAAGPSAVLDPTFGELRRLVDDIRAPDGSPAIGEPTHALDSSEITVELPFAPDAILPPRLRNVLASAFGVRRLSPSQGEAEVLVPAWQVRIEFPEAEHLDPQTQINGFYQLDLRASTTPNDRMYFSGATLDTDAHLALLQGIVQVIPSQDS